MTPYYVATCHALLNDESEAFSALLCASSIYQVPVLSTIHYAFWAAYPQFGNALLVDRSNNIALSKSFVNVLATNSLVQSTTDFLSSTKNPMAISINNNNHCSTDDMSLLSAKERLRYRLELYDLVERPVPGDGNCQFYSLSDQLYGSLGYASDIRAKIVQWLQAHQELQLENGAKLSDFVTTNTWEEYCSMMSKVGTWGDHLTLVAAAELFGVCITIVSSVDDQNFVMEIRPSVVLSQKVLLLSHYAEFHFGSLTAKVL